MQAAIDTLDAEGIVGTSARAIARRGAFNQALIFYHFGSVDGLLIEAAKAEGTKRALRYTESLAKVSSTRELIAVAHQIHRHEQSSGSVNVLAQLLAGANTSPELREGVRGKSRYARHCTTRPACPFSSIHVCCCRWCTPIGEICWQNGRGLKLAYLNWRQYCLR